MTQSSAPKIGGGKLADNPQVLDSWLAGEQPGPLVVEVSATGGCNHGCLHCGYQLFNPYDTRKSFLNKAAYVAFLEDFKAMGGVEVFYAGRGDPLLNPDTVDYCRIGHALKLSNVMSTNGIPVNERRIGELIPSMNWIRFSVNGGDADTYAAIHRCAPTDFAKLERNLTIAARVRDEQGLATQLVIQFIIYDQNAASLDGLVALHRRVGTDRLVIRNVYEKDGSRRVPTAAVLAALERVRGMPGIEIRDETFDLIAAGPQWTKCYGINFRCNLDEHGNVYACPSNNIKPCVIGNINEQRFRDIWRSERRREVFANIQPGGYIPSCGHLCDVSKDNLYAQAFVERTGAVVP